MKKLCPQFHLSLQSGCNATLKRMNRRYTAEEYERTVNLLRSTLKDASITTDVIVGFPGETDEEFNETYEFLKRNKLTKTHVFKFSPRTGTKAADMKDQVDGNKKDERSKKLIELNEKNEAEFTESLVGREMGVLIEQEVKGQEDIFEGYTRNFVKVHVSGASKEDVGDIVKVKILSSKGDYAEGKVVK